MASRLVERVRDLWLSRSWTTRAPRPGESEDAYVFTDRAAFQAHAAGHGFLEWAEFLGELYGTPWPDPPQGSDVLLEIDLQGARQVLAGHPEAVVVLLVPPSPEALAQRMRRRGDPEEQTRARVQKGAEEERQGRQLAHYVVVNDDLERAVGELVDIVEHSRATSEQGEGRAPKAAGKEAGQRPEHGAEEIECPKPEAP